MKDLTAKSVITLWNSTSTERAQVIDSGEYNNMIRDSLPHTFLLMPREELNDVNLEDLLIYFSEVKSRVGLHRINTNTDVWYICQLKISGDEGYSLKERLGEREYLEKYVEFMPKSVLRQFKTGVLTDFLEDFLHDKYYNTVEYRNWLEEMNTTSNRMADRYGEPLPEEPKPNWIKYIEEILINREELLETAKRKNRDYDNDTDDRQKRRR
jgi:hypothetical protein